MRSAETPVECEMAFFSNKIALSSRFMDWDFSVLRECREDVVHKFRTPWVNRRVSGREWGALQAVHAELESYFSEFYGHLGPPQKTHFTYRPEITGPEPLHYDQELGVVITAFVNWDTEPRVWGVGPVRDKPGKSKNPWMKEKLVEGTIEFAPGQMWVVRAETVAHQIIYGRGCVQFNWHLF